MGVHCSQRARRAEEAERDVDERYKCAWMEKHIGEQFDGTVTGVTSFGLFVELAQSLVSGLVHITQLPNDYYHFDPKRRQLEGERSHKRFRLGDVVRVQVLRASLEDRKIDFRLVTTETSPATQAHAPAARAKPAKTQRKKAANAGGKSVKPRRKSTAKEAPARETTSSRNKSKGKGKR